MGRKFNWDHCFCESRRGFLSGFERLLAWLACFAKHTRMRTDEKCSRVYTSREKFEDENKLRKLNCQTRPRVS